jgi:hypothetical protein
VDFFFFLKLTKLNKTNYFNLKKKKITENQLNFFFENEQELKINKILIEKFNLLNLNFINLFNTNNKEKKQILTNLKENINFFDKKYLFNLNLNNFFVKKFKLINF